MKALDKLIQAQHRTGSLLSIGLEPSLGYLPRGFEKNLEGCESFLKLIIEATQDLACAYKFNLAFFESHGWEGMEMLYAVREAVPDDVLLIGDAKRGDIGTSARHYAVAMYDKLEVDSVTINPLLGRDSAVPFLEYEDKLNFFLGLTSNPGASEFLLPNDLFLQIGRRVSEWNTARNCGLVAGATHPEHLGELRRAAPAMPFLVPGIGAQGGDLERTLREGYLTPEFSGLILHVTRGVLPTEGDPGDPGMFIRSRTEELNGLIAAAVEAMHQQ